MSAQYSAKWDSLLATEPAMDVHRANGLGPVVLICEHASAAVPAIFANLGLMPEDLQRHIGWDIGASALALQLSDALDAPLILARQSRLLMDLNRDPQAPDSIPAHSDGTPIPGNQQIDSHERELRRRWLYEPFHAAIDQVLQARLLRGQPTAVLSIHSFTRSLNDYARPWQMGVLSDQDRRLADALLSGLRTNPEHCVGDNQPYAPQQGVYHTVARHGQNHGLLCAMIEIRNDQLAAVSAVQQWRDTLLNALHGALALLWNTEFTGPGRSGVGVTLGARR